MVSITDAKQIIRLATDAEIKVFLDGGWGVDALIGYGIDRLCMLFLEQESIRDVLLFPTMKPLD